MDRSTMLILSTIIMVLRAQSLFTRDLVVGAYRDRSIDIPKDVW